MKSPTTVVRLRQPDEIDDPLTEVLRAGARRLLAQAVEMEADAFLAAMQDLRLPDGRARLVRHGHGPEREIQTGIGPVPVARVQHPGSRCQGCGRSGPLLLDDPAEVGAADPQPRCAVAGVVPARHLHRRLPGGARGAAGQGRPEPVARRCRPAHRRPGQTSTSAGRRAISRHAATSTSGPTASTCKPGWRIRPSACWCWSAPRQRAGRNLSASRSACARARRAGASCWSR